MFFSDTFVPSVSYKVDLLFDHKRIFPIWHPEPKQQINKLTLNNNTFFFFQSNLPLEQVVDFAFVQLHLHHSDTIPSHPRHHA